MYKRSITLDLIFPPSSTLFYFIHLSIRFYISSTARAYQAKRFFFMKVLNKSVFLDILKNNRNVITPFSAM